MLYQDFENSKELCSRSISLSMEQEHLYKSSGTYQIKADMNGILTYFIIVLCYLTLWLHVAIEHLK